MPADLPIKSDPAVLADLVVKRGIGGCGRFGDKAGSGGLAGSELKLGIDRFAGKSEITEGCSDLREIGDSSDLPGISDVRLQRATGAMLLVRRCGGAANGGVAGTSVAAVGGRRFDAAVRQ